MASGKSHVGRLLAQEIGWKLVDADEQIVLRAGKTIEAIFQTEGEAAFRALEALVVAELCSRSGQVVATGGGAFLNSASRQAMLDRGLVFCLEARPETICRRLGYPISGPTDGKEGENHPDSEAGLVESLDVPVRPLLVGNDGLERILFFLSADAQPGGRTIPAPRSSDGPA